MRFIKTIVDKTKCVDIDGKIFEKEIV